MNAIKLKTYFFLFLVVQQVEQLYQPFSFVELIQQQYLLPIKNNNIPLQKSVRNKEQTSRACS